MKALIIGANSDIAFELAKIWSSRSYELFLAVRNTELFESRCSEAKLSNYHILSFDASKDESIDSIKSSEIEPDVVLFAHGILDEAESANLVEYWKVNYLSIARLSEHYCQQMAKKRMGSILAIGSVAGLRGRASNFHYGASKAALHTLFSGLRNKWSKNGVQVSLILPGPIQTKMTANIELKSPLVASAIKAAKDIDKAFLKKKDISYNPWYWRYIMIVIRSIPEFIFKKPNL